MNCRTVVFSGHASRRMLTRGITFDEVLALIRTGEIIEEYPTDTPFPSFLLLGGEAKRVLRVLVAADQQTGACVVVTIYQPDQTRWNPGFRMRRRQ